MSRSRNAVTAGVSPNIRGQSSRAIRCDDRRRSLVASHHNLQEVFGGVRRQFSHAKIVQDKELDLRCVRDSTRAHRIGKYEFLKQNVRFTIQNVKAGVNCGHSDCLRDVAFSDARVPEHHNVIVWFDEATCGEIKDKRAIEAGVERPIERVERFDIAEARVLYT